MMGRGFSFAVVALAIGALTLPAMAEMVEYGAELSGSNESPPNGSPASGMATATLDTETRELKWTVEFSAMTGPAIGAHIHGPAEAGSNAGIMVPFKTLESPIEGSATLTEEQIGHLDAGGLYVNLHTAAHPGGELRGQLIRK